MPYGPPAPFLINILPVGVPPQLDQSQLVIRQGATDAMVLDNDRWLSPLGDEIRSALSADLSTRLATREVSGLVSRADALPVLKIHLQVRRFDVWPGQLVKFAADWRLSRPRGDRRVELICHSQFTELALGDDATMLAAQRRVITRLAAQIATQARNWIRDDRDVCAAP